MWVEPRKVHKKDPYIYKGLSYVGYIRKNLVGSHDSDSLLGTTRVVSGARVLGRLVPNGLPKGKKADTRPWVDLTNEAQHVETHEVSVERAEEKNAVDHQDPVSSLLYSRKKRFTCSARET